MPSKTDYAKKLSMKCPKCHYHSFDFLDACPKCGADWKGYKERFNIIAFKPGELDFLEELLSGEEEIKSKGNISSSLTESPEIILETPTLEEEEKETEEGEEIEPQLDSTTATQEDLTPFEETAELTLPPSEPKQKGVFEELEKAHETLDELEELEQPKDETEVELPELPEPTELELQEEEPQQEAEPETLDLEFPTASLEGSQQDLENIDEQSLDLEGVEPSLEESDTSSLEILEDIDRSEKQG